MLTSAQLKIGHNFTPGVFQPRFGNRHLLLRLLYGRALLHDRIYDPSRIDLRRRVERRVQGGDFGCRTAGESSERFELLQKQALGHGIVDGCLFRLDFGLQHVG